MSQLVESLKNDDVLNLGQSLSIFSDQKTVLADEIDHSKLLCEDISRLADSHDFCDVTFVVGSERIHAHRIILAARCLYFRALLFGGLKESQEKNEIVIKGVNSHAFKVLLRYAYTGKLKVGGVDLDRCVDILALANQYGYEDLEVSIANHLKESLTISNCCFIYNIALLYNQIQLTSHAADFVDRHCHDVIASTGFLKLSLDAVTSLLSRDSFCVQEKVVFRCAQKWCEANLVDDDPDKKMKQQKVLSTVRLPLICLNDLLNTIRPTGLVSPDCLLDAVKIQSTEPVKQNLLSRGILRPDENVATMSLGAYVVNSLSSSTLLGDEAPCWTHRNEPDHYTNHEIMTPDQGGEERGIKIRLGLPSIINCIRLLLWNGDLRSYSYYVQTSVDDQTWQTVVDYSDAYCRSWQELRFERHVVRYIRVVGTRSTANKYFHLVSLQARFSSEPVEMYQHYIIPTTNVASLSKCARIIEGVSRDRNALINGDQVNYDWDSGYTCHQLDNGRITVQLAQPFALHSMKLLLWDMDTRDYSYYIETSLDNKMWTKVVDKRKEACKSWQYLNLERLTPASFIRIVGTNNSANEVFHCVHFESSGVLLSLEDEGLNDEDQNNEFIDDIL